MSVAAESKGLGLNSDQGRRVERRLASRTAPGAMARVGLSLTKV